MSDDVLQVFVFRSGAYVGSEVFVEPEIIIGSSPDADLVLEGAGVASKHAVLTHAGGRATILDLGTGLATMVNRASVEHSYVTARDEIQIGSHTLKLKMRSADRSVRPSAVPAPAPAPAPSSMDARVAPRAIPLTDDLTEQATELLQAEAPPVIDRSRPSVSLAPIPARPTARLVDHAVGRPAAKETNVPTDLVRDRKSPSIDDLIAGEIGRNLSQITASIEISGSDVVEARPIDERGRRARAEAREAEAAAQRDLQRLPDELGSSIEIALDSAFMELEEPAPRAPEPQSYVDDITGASPSPARAPKSSERFGPTTSPIPTPVARVEPVRAAPARAEQAPPAPRDRADTVPRGPDLVTLAPDDELDPDEIEENERPGFSLAETLVGHATALPEGAPLSVEIIDFLGDAVRSAVLLTKPGDRYVLGKRVGGTTAPEAGHRGLKLARRTSAHEVVLEFPSGADGIVMSEGRRTSLDALKIPENAVSKKGALFRAKLRPGETVTMDLGGHGFHVRFVGAPRLALGSTGFNFDRQVGQAVLSSVVVHLIAGLIVGLTTPGVSYSGSARETWAEPPREELRDVEIKPPEPPPPEPEPEPIVDDAPPDTAPEPEPETRRRPREKRGAPKGVPKTEVKSAGVLGAMGKLNLAAPGKKSMVAAVSNVDAVRAPGGSNFRLGGLVGKAPTSEVQLGGGGGGSPLTRGSAALLKGGEGFAKIGKREGSEVRGKVGRANARRLVAKGSISREEVARVINEHLKEVHRCYEKALLKDPGLEGKLTLEWTIRADGGVGRVRQMHSTIRNPEVASCIMERLERWRFPKPRGGVVVVSYPFIFSSVGF